MQYSPRAASSRCASSARTPRASRVATKSSTATTTMAVQQRSSSSAFATTIDAALPINSSNNRRTSRRASPSAVTALSKSFIRPASSSTKALPTVVPPPSYRIPAVWLALNAATAAAHVALGGDSLSSQAPGFALASLLPIFLAVQASRVRFVFGPETLEVVVGTDTPEEAAEGKGIETENRFVGGKNEWGYDAFVNWEFFPSKRFPVLVYFKETQTKPEGQIHFFPVLFQAKELYAVMKERCGPSVNSG